MELNELKNIYSALDKKFERNNNFNEKIYTEMMKSKGKKSTNRLLAYELFGAVTCTLLLPVLVFFFNKNHGWYILWDIYVAVAMILIAFLLFWSIYKMVVLMKVDFQNTISNNIYLINRYNILIKREKISVGIGGAFFAALAVVIYAHAKAAIWLWVFLTCGIIFATLITYWSYKKFYKDNIASIVESLNNLNELKEDIEEETEA